MIKFEHFELANGLKVYVHEDHSTPMAVLNLLYNVGARDELADKTGFAHLFEHLMFGGSVNVPSFDEPLQLVGGENNAFTNNDITNYYITLPAANLETAFWLESDRMLSLSFDPEVLEVQRKVVIEEFKQRYLNQPYGDVWLKLRPLAYQEHPYRWATIGKEISHIEEATMEDVKSFFKTHYIPNNAYLVIAGDVTLEEAKRLTEKWFGGIPAGKLSSKNWPKEPKQNKKRILEVSAEVPSDALYMTFHMCGRLDADYYATDLMSEILGRGKSSRLFKELVKEKRVFNSISAYITGSVDPGLLVISGKLNDGFDTVAAEKAVWEVIQKMREEGIQKEELEKTQNQAEAALQFGEVELLNRAMNLAIAAAMGRPNLVNEEPQLINAVTVADVNRLAKEILIEENCSVLYYMHRRQ